MGQANGRDDEKMSGSRAKKDQTSEASRSTTTIGTRVTVGGRTLNGAEIYIIREV